MIGRQGTVTIAIDGGPAAGEVSVQVRGVFELFIAYADGPLGVGQTILVYNSRGARDVDVIIDPTFE